MLPAAPRPHLRALVDDEAAFFEVHWERAFALSEGGPERAARFGALLTADELLGLIADHGLRSPFFRLIRDGGTLAESSYLRSAGVGHTTVHDLANTGRMAQEVWQGASIVGQALQRTWPPLRDFCRGLAGELGHRVQANAYLSPPEAHGFDLHYDTHDVFILQVEGAKDWTVHAPEDLLPLRRRPGAPPPSFGEPVWSGTLEPGDCLYLPRGFGHSARTSESASLHLTIGVLVFTWRHVLRLLGEVLPEGDAELRQALPPGSLLGDGAVGDTGIDGGIDGAGFDGAWKEFRSRLMASIDALDPEVVADRLRGQLWAAHPPLDAADELTRAVRGELPGPDATFVLRPGALEGHEVVAGRVRLVRRDRVIAVPDQAASLVERLLEGVPVRADDPRNDLDADSALTVLRRLYREGLLDLVRP